MRLKQQARLLVVGVALSAATLAIIPGAAEATGTCGCPDSGGTDGSGGNTNTSTGNVGQVTLQDGADLTNTSVANNNNVGLNAPVLSPGSDQKTSGNGQTVDNSGSSGSGTAQESNTNTSTHNVGQATLQDGVDLTNTNVANNNNIGANVPVLSPGSNQSTSGNEQSVDNSGGDGTTPLGGGGGGTTPPGGGGDSKQKFNSGNGNGSEGGDPGNSGLTGANNAGGDEVGQEGGTRENPGGQNSPPKDNKGA